MQLKPRIAILAALFMLVAIMVVPVSAAEYTPTNDFLWFTGNKTTSHFTGVYNATHDASADGKRIAIMSFTIPAESRVDFTLYYGNGSTVSGYLQNYHINPLQTVASVSLGGDSKEYTYIDAQPLYDINIAGYARTNDANATTGFLVYSSNYGLFDNDLAVFYEVASISQNTIYRIDATGDKPFDLSITDASIADVASGASKTYLDIMWEWINFAISLASFVMGAVLMIFGIIKFFFIDNLLLVVALWLGVTMAYSAVSSGGNIFKFYTRFFRLQRSLINFILEMWHYLIIIISEFRGIFRI